MGRSNPGIPYDPSAGRWPPNVILDPEAAALLDAMSGERKSGWKDTDKAANAGKRSIGVFKDEYTGTHYGDSGGSSRFFPVLPVDDPDTTRFMYCAKASRRERNAGLEGMPEREREGTSGNNRPMRVCLECGRMKGGSSGNCQCGPTGIIEKPLPATANHHPTVKPLALMRWLLTLVTPPNGIILDPFAGSGSTLVAAAQLGIAAIGIEMDPEYCEISARRIDHAINERERGAVFGNGTDASRAKESISIHGYKGNSFSQSYKQSGTNPELDEYRINDKGRWPSNVIMDRDAAALLDAMSEVLHARGNVNGTKAGRGMFHGETQETPNNYQYIDPHNGASRFMTVIDDGDEPPRLAQMPLEGCAD